ncbi:hypothetical protein ABIA38_007948 [Embleya sp. AB8]
MPESGRRSGDAGVGTPTVPGGAGRERSEASWAVVPILPGSPTSPALRRGPCGAAAHATSAPPPRPQPRPRPAPLAALAARRARAPPSHGFRRDPGPPLLPATTRAASARLSSRLRRSLPLPTIPCRSRPDFGLPRSRLSPLAALGLRPRTVSVATRAHLCFRLRPAPPGHGFVPTPAISTSALDPVPLPSRHRLAPLAALAARRARAPPSHGFRRDPGPPLLPAMTRAARARLSSRLRRPLPLPTIPCRSRPDFGPPRSRLSPLGSGGIRAGRSVEMCHLGSRRRSRAKGGTRDRSSLDRLTLMG